jgi:hypothetical protein
MKKPIVMLAILVLAAMACTSVQFANPNQPPASTPDALATVLAEVAAATQKAPPEPIATLEPTTAIVVTPEQLTPTSQPALPLTATPELTATYSGFPTAIPLPNPRTTDFTTCLGECLSDGSNHQTSFPEKTELIHFRFEFEEFPLTAPYTRVWYREGVEWVRYRCLWPGPESGVEEITLTDPFGLPSGTWNVVVNINGVEVLNETLKIEGSWNQWTPPGYFNSCYGKR